MHYYRPTDPVYQPAWRYCPYCGVEWEGPIRCDVDNERMYGERKKRIYNAPRPDNYPNHWWVIIQKETKYSRETPIWKLDPRRYSAVQALGALNAQREEDADFADEADELTIESWSHEKLMESCFRYSLREKY
jgi:hypothetical protein